MYSSLVTLIVGEYIAAPICPPWPDPSVYIIRSCAGIRCSRCWYSFATSSLLEVGIAVMAVNFHQEGLKYAAMCSMLDYMYSE
jgi:hypothetical protein